MMECRRCGRYAPPDTGTGFDAEDLCPSCALDDDEQTDEGGQPTPERIDPEALAEQSILMALEALHVSVQIVSSLDRALDLHRVLGDIARRVVRLQDELAVRMDGMTGAH